LPVLKGFCAKLTWAKRDSSVSLTIILTGLGLLIMDGLLDADRLDVTEILEDINSLLSHPNHELN